MVGGQGFRFAVDKGLKIGEHRASQLADLNALSAKLEEGETVLKAFCDSNPDPKLIKLGASLKNALMHGTALHGEAHTAHENYNAAAGVLELGGAFEWVTGNYAPRLQESKGNIEQEILSVTDHMHDLHAQTQVPFGGYGGFEVGQQIDAWRSSECWSAVTICEIKDSMATVVGSHCDGARFTKKLPLDFHYVKPSDWPTQEALFLPLSLQGEQVLVADDKEPNVWLVTNDALKSTESGIGYRRSKNLEDHTLAQGCCANWNHWLVGVDEGDGWVRCWPKVRQMVELKNQDDHDAVFIHLSNSQGETSCDLLNGTQLEVIGQYDGDSFMVEYKGKGYGVQKRHCKRSSLQQAEKKASLPGTQAVSCERN